MSTRLVILGLLRDRPLYGYEIKHIIEDHMGDWTSIAFGSIYFALDKLAAEEFIEKVGIEQEGNRPSRSVYQITPDGREEFLRLLRENWQQIERHYFSLDICLFFLDTLPAEEVIAFLQEREKVLQTSLDHLREHRDEQLSSPELPPQASAIFDHTMVHTRAELEWVTGLIQKLEGGDY